MLFWPWTFFTFVGLEGCDHRQICCVQLYRVCTINSTGTIYRGYNVDDDPNVMGSTTCLSGYRGPVEQQRREVTVRYQDLGLGCRGTLQGRSEELGPWDKTNSNWFLPACTRNRFNLSQPQLTHLL